MIINYLIRVTQIKETKSILQVLCAFLVSRSRSVVGRALGSKKSLFIYTFLVRVRSPAGATLFSVFVVRTGSSVLGF